jgi:hypothetical protein
MKVKSKKILKIIIAIAVILLILVVINVVKDSYRYTLFELIGKSALSAKEDIYYDDQEGIFGEGDTIISWKVTDSKQAAVKEKIENSDKWSAYPLPTSLSDVVYGKTNISDDDYEKYLNTTQTLSINSTEFLSAISVNGENVIPLIKDGYYYYRNLSNDDDSSVKDTSSSYALAVYDPNTGIVYYYEHHR